MFTSAGVVPATPASALAPHWHGAITMPAGAPGGFRTRVMPASAATEAEARRKAAEPIAIVCDDGTVTSLYEWLAEVAAIWIRQEEPYLLIPGVAILAVYPCDGDHEARRQAYLREVMLRAAVHGDPFAASEEEAGLVPPWCG